ncbi:MAG: allantoinase PuuE [Pseudomonadota bacterium]
MTDPYPRDLAGYRGHPPHPRWPGGARIAVQVVLNIEEGGENCLLHGDAASEAFLSEIIGAEPWPGQRHPNMESIYEYGSRAGVWRILDLIRARGLPITLFTVASAAERTPWIIDRALEDGHEIACHGLRWIDYRHMAEAEEAAHMEEAIAILKRLTGAEPLGWYTGRTSENTRRLVAQRGTFLYDADDYSDDLPFWSRIQPGHLVVPYTLDNNDMRFATAQGFHSAEQFFAYLRDAFDVLWAEGETAPKMMSIGLHARLVGRPGRFRALQRFLDHAAAHEDVWFARRVDIARHWRATHPAPA